MKVLGIETSCDETAVAVYASDGGLLAHEVYSQIALHAEYGGVVPELASRDHIRKLSPLVEQVLGQVGGEVDAVAYTAGPGLLGALLVGAAFARSFAFARGLPACGVHHLEGHLLAPLLEDDAPEFPFVALLVSGGHTLLVDVAGVGQYRLLGESLDDAAGEAFDKTAKMMGLPYPGGPALAKLAETGQPGRYDFPRPMTKKPGLDFSFSGLKTAALLAWRDSAQDETARANIARSFEDAIVETLLIKCRRAQKATDHHRLVVAGGVGANKRLRAALADDAKCNKGAVYFPRPEFCTDNAAMIAYAGWQRLRHGVSEPAEIRATARWPLDSLQSPERAFEEQQEDARLNAIADSRSNEPLINVKIDDL